MYFFLSHIKDERIQIKTDNTTAAAYLNNQGGVKSMACHAEGRLVWEWAIARNCHISAVNCHISAVHLPGSNNIFSRHS